MPNVKTLSRPQKAVLWSANGTDDRGRVKVDAPVELDVRWTEKQGEALDAQGNTIRTDVTVVVGQDVVVGSIMWLGLLVTALAATPTSGLKQAVANDKIPDLKGRSFYRTVSLIRYGDTLPTLA